MELVHEAYRLEGELSVVVVDVEQASLRAHRWGGLRLVDRGRDSVDMQDAGQSESAWSGADDRDGLVHGDSWGSGPPNELGPAVPGTLPGIADKPPTSSWQPPMDGRQRVSVPTPARRGMRPGQHPDLASTRLRQQPSGRCVRDGASAGGSSHAAPAAAQITTTMATHSPTPRASPIRARPIRAEMAGFDAQQDAEDAF